VVHSRYAAQEGHYGRPADTGAISFRRGQHGAQVLQDINLAGRVTAVTGGYSGIGLETVRALAAAGATVIVPARNLVKAQRALSGLANVSIDTLDLSDPASIDGFAERFQRQHDTLHLLINNAGLVSWTLQRDQRGYEVQFATNHLGHFHLTARLWPALIKHGARVVSVSSRGHAVAPVDFDDINFDRRPYDPMVAYGQSKSARPKALRRLRSDRPRTHTAHVRRDRRFDRGDVAVLAVDATSTREQRAGCAPHAGGCSLLEGLLVVLGIDDRPALCVEIARGRPSRRNSASIWSQMVAVPRSSPKQRTTVRSQTTRGDVAR
jgi:hypothetical protein